MQTICDSSKSTYHCTKLENRFITSLGWPHGLGGGAFEQKPEASLQLNKTVRQLYDSWSAECFHKTRTPLTTCARSSLLFRRCTYPAFESRAGTARTESLISACTTSSAR